MNRGLFTALSAVAAAQLLKLPMHYARKGEWKLKRLVGSGGMPSAHSSGVSALAAYTAIRYGIKTPEFALASMLGLIVMYDAMNIRRYAGEISIQVNDLDRHVEDLAGHHPGIYHQKRKQQLKERLGHQPEEVWGGACLGTVVGACSALTEKYF